uniref:Serpin family B member 10 n=1 Tax=Pelusios castaneus TaxID=367368 RepID=A0A8C8VQT6_9SAUR
MEALSMVNTHFALDLFKYKCKTQTDKNLLFSPWSISTAMAMVYLGAKGNTAEQMAEVSWVYRESNDLFGCNCPVYSQITHTRTHTNDFLSLALKDYLQSIKKYYRTEPQAVDFMGDAEKVRRQINSSVERQTEGKIQELLPVDSVDSLTKLVLVNALYFKGNWAKKFKDGFTKEQPFRMTKNTTKPVQMMFQREKFNWTYIKTVHTHIIELPYVGNDLSMLILLPDDISDDTTGLEMLERDLTYEKLSKWTSSEMMEKTEVDVYLPRIKMEESYDLKSTLSSMGMQDAFSEDRADFRGMSEKNDLVLSHVFHKCFVEINEEGTEAAAATAASMTTRSLISAIQFIADHPFLFFLRHNETKTILFLGRFCSP